MKSLSQIIEKYHPRPWAQGDFRSVTLEAMMEEYAHEVLEWILNETDYIPQQGMTSNWWEGGERNFTSEDLLNQYNKLPIIEQKK